MHEHVGTYLRVNTRIIRTSFSTYGMHKSSSYYVKYNSKLYVKWTVSSYTDKYLFSVKPLCNLDKDEEAGAA